MIDTNTTARPVKLSEAQKRVLSWMAQGHSARWDGTQYEINGGTVRFTEATMQVLITRRLVCDEQYRNSWKATEAGRAAFEQMRAEGDKGE